MCYVVELSPPSKVKKFVFSRLSTEKGAHVFAVFFAPIPGKEISDFIAQGLISQIFTVLEPRISHHGNRARQIESAGDQPLLARISELVQWHSL